MESAGVRTPASRLIDLLIRLEEQKRETSRIGKEVSERIAGIESELTHMITEIREILADQGETEDRDGEPGQIFSPDFFNDIPDEKLRRTLQVLIRNDNETADKIGEILKRDRSTVCQYLNTLKMMGYVTKEREGHKIRYSVRYK
ncbi:MAG TPA: helix-turn-helix domain-containing protein [Methanospirillum sp.]|nr:helix-turn-helix domain-containing protein [Methanospirillum sp.]